MRFVRIGHQELDADKVDSVFAEHCGACGWHYLIIAKMAGGNKITLDQISWNPEWGEYGTEAAYLKGRDAFTALVHDITNQLSEVQ